MKISCSMLAGASLLALSCVSALAQQVTGVPGTPSATTTIDGKQIPPSDPTFGGVIKEKADGSQDRKYLTLADETRAAAFQTVLRPLEDRHLVTRGMKKGCREEATERATSDYDFERAHWSELPIQSSRVSFWQKAGCLHAPRPGRLRISPRIGDGVNF
jgi:hypothetical protein